MSFAAFAKPENALRCRSCEPEMPRHAPARPFQCYLGGVIEDLRFSDGSRRVVVVFVCCDCGEHRYLDLATGAWK